LTVRRVLGALRSVLDVRVYLHALKLLHYYSYTHVGERRKMRCGARVRIAPNVSIANGERIEIGADSNIGAHCSLWAGDSTGRIILGRHALLAPEVFITASNYRIEPGIPVVTQPKIEQDVIIGDDVWLGAGVIVLPGVHIGEGCIVGAGAVVTRSVEPFTIVAGNPARPIGQRTSVDQRSLGMRGTRG
jgi:acetyltransferase-like isoleucine patch superfamily enzyme